LNYELSTGKETNMVSARGKSIIVMISLLFLTSCASGKVPVSKFTRIDKKTGNFTKHLDESVFKISEKGMYSVEVLLFDRNLRAGRNDFDIVLHDRKDRDVENAELRITARMPGSGLEAKPRITSSIPGLYSLWNLDLVKAGSWELMIHIKDGDYEDSVVFDFPDVGK
jgi:hypothetical protein